MQVNYNNSFFNALSRQYLMGNILGKQSAAKQLILGQLSLIGQQIGC
jgi:hypothetical protein